MVDKTISFEELAALRDEGAEFEFDRRPLTIDRLDELITKLDALVKAQEERTRADLARSQTQLEVLAHLQSQVKQSSQKLPPLDLSPLRDVIADIQAASESRSRAAYSFDVKRDGRGYLEQITAKPIQPTLN